MPVYMYNYRYFVLSVVGMIDKNSECIVCRFCKRKALAKSAKDKPCEKEVEKY